VGGSSTSEIIAKGISEALVATQTGMIVAIPGFMMAHVARRWRDEYVSFLARLEGLTLRHFRRVFRAPEPAVVAEVPEMVLASTRPPLSAPARGRRHPHLIESAEPRPVMA
jgi:hypothetical protein